MFIDIRAIGFELTDPLRRHVEARVERALGPFARRVVSATARLEDVNADHGGIDKRCGMVVTLPRLGTVVAESTREDLYVAVDEVGTRIRRSVERAIRRRVARERRDRQRPGTLIAI